MEKDMWLLSTLGLIVLFVMTRFLRQHRLYTLCNRIFPDATLLHQYPYAGDLYATEEIPDQPWCAVLSRPWSQVKCVVTDPKQYLPKRWHHLIRPERLSCTIKVQSAHWRFPAHYDCYDNHSILLFGRKRILTWTTRLDDVNTQMLSIKEMCNILRQRGVSFSLRTLRDGQHIFIPVKTYHLTENREACVWCSISNRVVEESEACQVDFELDFFRQIGLKQQWEMNEDARLSGLEKNISASANI
jgi:hypothetical protein